MKKKKKIIIIIISIVLFIVLFLVIGNLLYRKHNKNTEVKQILESFGCIFLEENQSEENGFDKDFFVEFNTLPVDTATLISNKPYYERLIKTVSTQMQGKQFRIIDSKKNIIIRIKEDNKNVSYTINNNSNYYETELAKLTNNIDNQKKIINLEITSEELNTIIQNDWSKNQSKNVLGTIDGSLDDYDYYVDEGYSIKTRGTKIFNFTFYTNYNKEVFEGIKTGLKNEQIKNILGKPVYESEDANYIVGYKTNNYYVFFREGNISIYRKEEFNQDLNNKFASLVTRLNENKNYDEFLEKLTELYPDYDKYSRTEQGVELTYPLRGFKVEINKNKKGITFYNNYEGKITEDLNYNSDLNGKTIPKNIFYSKYNSLLEYELTLLLNRNIKSKNE